MKLSSFVSMLCQPFRFLTIGILLAGVLGISSCHCRSKKILVKSSLQTHADIAILVKEVRRHLERISDSGTLYGNTLNFADTVKAALGQKAVAENWFHYILSNKSENLSRIVAFGKLANEHGLDESFYHARMLQVLLFRINRHAWDSIVAYDSVALALIYSADASLGFYHDMRRGRVDPSYTGSLDALPRRHHGMLLAMLNSDTATEAMERAIPNFVPYTRLQKDYSRLYHLPKSALGKQLAPGKNVLPGDSIARPQLRALARKLRMHGYLNVSDSVADNFTLYDTRLSEAVKSFQVAHYLPPFGILDKETRELLNTRYDVMLLRLRANLERWRWLGPVKEDSRVWANIAENKVYAYKQDTLKLEMNICSGKNRDDKYYEKLEASKEDEEVVPPDNLETPLMKAMLSHLVVNPSWFVPRNIMTKELLPQIQEDPGILAEKNYILRNHKGEEIDPFSVDWLAVTPKNWKYRIEQKPGDGNALGQVVIHFPNSYSIFMHDTPSKNAFGWLDRHVSHGCVRMEHPMQMVEFITAFHKKDNTDDIFIAAGMEPVHDEKRIKKYLADIKDSAKAEKLKPKPNAYFKAEKSIPVYLVYFTCATNDAGGIFYYTDNYNRDLKLLQEMKRPRKNKREVARKTLPKGNSFSP
jgi:murein L,D-transpeptidase YcbB/YkuD